MCDKIFRSHLRRGRGRGDLWHQRRHPRQTLLSDVVARAAVDGGGQLWDVDPAVGLLHLEPDADPEDDEQTGEHARDGALRGVGVAGR